MNGNIERVGAWFTIGLAVVWSTVFFVGMGYEVYLLVKWLR